MDGKLKGYVLRFRPYLPDQAEWGEHHWPGLIPMEASVLHEKDQAGSSSFPEMKDDLATYNAIILKKVTASILDVLQLDENLQRLDRCSRLVKNLLQHEPN